MGMPITVAIPDRERAAGTPPWVRFQTTAAAVDAVFSHFRRVDERFSPYKPGSETSRIDRGELAEAGASEEMREVIALAEGTRMQTAGFFDVRHDGRFDPSGLVKGWAIDGAARLLAEDGIVSFCVEAGGDMELRGTNEEGEPWTVGIRSPFDPSRLIRRLRLTDRGIATSGTYIRGRHIWNPVTGGAADEIASLTVVGPNVYEADRFATAAFAMGKDGIVFVGSLPGLDAYMVDKEGTATFTPGFTRYIS